jgi:hypothetical protein
VSVRLPLRLSSAAAAGSLTGRAAWNGVNQHLLATGAADGVVAVFDHRNVSPPQPPLPRQQAAVDRGRRRQAGGRGAEAMQTLAVHKEAVQSLEWRPASASHLASGADDAALLVLPPALLLCPSPRAERCAGQLWDVDRKAEAAGGEGGGEEEAPPPQLIFKHAGHRYPPPPRPDRPPR